MSVTAFVFSGQGSQYPGMGLELAAEDPSVARLFSAAERIRPGTLECLKSADPKVLSATENAQPCLYLADLAAAIRLENLGVRPAALAGFSLGELPALAFGGAFSHEDGFRAVCVRGKLMGRESGKLPTGMAAVLKLPENTVREICSRFGIYPVNYNAPGQVTVSGETAALALAEQAFRDAGGRVVPLKVSGAFHSPFMTPAAREFEAWLSGLESSVPAVPVYGNRTAEPYGAPPHLSLASQMDSPVLWEQTVRNMARDGVDTFIEVGAGSTLAGLIGRILPNARVFSVDSPASAERAAGEVAA